MKKYNVAVLEDSKIILKRLINDIEELGLANVVEYATDTEDFILKTEKNKQIQALVLDIDIDGDSMNGIDVANHLNLPTLFISGKTKKYLNEIEDLQLFHDQPVKFLTKPIRDDKLKKVFEKFERLISQQNNDKIFTNSIHNEYLVIKTREAKKHSLKIAEIAFLDTKAGDGKRIVMGNGQEILTPRMNFKEIMEKLPSHFLKINNSTIINAKKVDRFLSIDEVGIPTGNKFESFIINSDYKEKLLDFRPEFR